jgi:actin-related protein 2
VRDWDDEKLILQYIWNEKLKIRPADHPVLITEAPLNPLENRRKMLEIFYESFGFNKVQISPQAILVLYAQGLNSGIVVDSGDGVTHIMPIYENYLLRQLVTRMNIAGRDITEHLVKLLRWRGYNFHQTSDFDIVRQIKEELCFVSADISVDRRISNETTAYVVPYTLPDGRIIKVSGERFEAPEVLFQPSNLGYEGLGLSELLYSTIMHSDIHLRKKFFESIVVSGGSAMFPGLSTRIYNDLKKMVGANILKGNKELLDAYKISVEDPPTRRFLVYLGGCVFADLCKDKSSNWATKREYSENGVEAVMRKWESISGA